LPKTTCLPSSLQCRCVCANKHAGISPSSLDGTQEELAAVRVRAGVGHRQYARSGVFLLEVLVGELFAVDRLAASAVVTREIATLCCYDCERSHRHTWHMKSVIIRWNLLPL
jgi:hypothetical protein